MKVAIPTFGDRVSPRFDCAQSFLVVSVEEREPSEREQLAASDWAPHERINRLLKLGVDTVVCGGIDCWSLESLESAGVAVYGWMTGETEEAISALLRGELDTVAQRGRDRCRRRRNRGASGNRRPELRDLSLTQERSAGSPS